MMVAGSGILKNTVMNGQVGDFAGSRQNYD